MLDGFAVHISHVQAAVWSISKLYRTKPVIGARDKFTLLLTLGSSGNWLHPVIVQTLAMNQVAPRISNESVSEEILSQCITAVDGDTSGSGEITRHTPTSLHRAAHCLGHTPSGAHNTPGFIRTQAENRS